MCNTKWQPKSILTTRLDGNFFLKFDLKFTVFQTTLSQNMESNLKKDRRFAR